MSETFLFSVSLQRQTGHSKMQHVKRHQACPFTLEVVSLVSGEVQLCTKFIEHVSCQRGRDLTTEGLEPYHDSCMRDVDVSMCLNCCLSPFLPCHVSVLALSILERSSRANGSVHVEFNGKCLASTSWHGWFRQWM